MRNLRNINPVGEVDLPLIGATLAPGEVFTVTDDVAAVLLEQEGNYEPADDADTASVALPSGDEGGVTE